MPESEWGKDQRTTQAAEVLVERIDRIGALLEAGSYDDAIAAAYGRRWVADADLVGVPSMVLRRAQLQLDSVCVALRAGNLQFARESLAGARRAITG